MPYNDYAIKSDEYDLFETTIKQDITQIRETERGFDMKPTNWVLADLAKGIITTTILLAITPQILEQRLTIIHFMWLHQKMYGNKLKWRF